ncbi:hypothetical protein GobsT_21520 [Gemmata obscuriglobus]|uniref:Penicillin-binding protein activator LpoB n=1 Tax=Gemmata obscuriglobus TaxID=114 RepID=A0A2Z3HCV5_9BACT|nr:MULTISPECIES: hypothetical protein [Gemmata]AWM39514.1 penicillin-binding protein activator LpoB [Gemmata obscuriglobus]MDY3551323.1 penicillin-binding protein activator LpoB [Gemmata algarum]QEG27396.1 hypothetical protein GobsT_21520 [Gemmata obscuriglobus]VTS04307.1 Uncharacterized protein OS=Planctomyces brasiliensis (strain ATCC 49424 / DSM 5305 / JCM 21570 / NBRC 103401 / IFAM 1448) GN=Plabr_2610 PE=4 SV=1: DUF3897 [Gemmata obscuriglobus UQM 2246]
MDRRRFLGLVGGSFAAAPALVGCRSKQVGEVIQDGKKDMVGSHAAGAETYKPMIDEAVAKLLARQDAGLQPASTAAPVPKVICFVGVQNKGSDDLIDWKDQINEIIDTKINNSQVFTSLSRKYVAAAIETHRLRPEDLFKPDCQEKFMSTMRSQGMPFDYLLFATTTTGTTQNNDSSQKDHLLTLELVNIQTGISSKESASIRKGYRKSRRP